MFDPAEEVQKAQRRLYWNRHAFTSFVVVTFAAVISLCLSPTGWPLFLASGVAGVVLFWGVTRRTLWGGVVAVAGFLPLLVVSWHMVPSEPIMWTQEIAPLFSSAWGLMLWFRSTKFSE
jgi:hypothetical protein